MTSRANPDRVFVGLRWERDFGLCIHTVLPGDCHSYTKVTPWSAIPKWISEVRWVREGLRSGEIVR